MEQQTNRIICRHQMAVFGTRYLLQREKTDLSVIRIDILPRRRNLFFPLTLVASFSNKITLNAFVMEIYIVFNIRFLIWSKNNPMTSRSLSPR